MYRFILTRIIGMVFVLITRLIKTSVLEVMGQDFIRTARLSRYASNRGIDGSLCGCLQCPDRCSLCRF